MISLRATLLDQASLPGKGGAPSVSGSPMPVSADAKGAAPAAFAALLKSGAANLPVQMPDEPATPQDGNILPPGNLPGTLLPLSAGLPLAPEVHDARFAEPTLNSQTKPDNETVPHSDIIEPLPVTPSAQAAAGLTLPRPETQPTQISDTAPVKPQAKAALAQNASIPIYPVAAPQTVPTPAVAGTKPQALAAQAPAITAALVVQQIKSGISPAGKLSSSVEPSISAVNTVPNTQFITTTSTRDALDMPRSLLTTAMPTNVISPGDPVIATGVVASAANPAPPIALNEAPFASHDFEALIDRLAQARETAQPGSARVSLPHSEFGQVNLRFDASLGTTANTMTVTMTSHDPDFALAARTALAERAVMAPDQARNEASSGRNDNTHNGHGNNGNGSGQTHGQGHMPGNGRPASNSSGQNPERGPALEHEHHGHDQAPNRGAEKRGLYA